MIIKAAGKRCKSETRLDRGFRLTGLPFWNNYHNFALLEWNTLRFIDRESISQFLNAVVHRFQLFTNLFRYLNMLSRHAAGSFHVYIYAQRHPKLRVPASSALSTLWFRNSTQAIIKVPVELRLCSGNWFTSTIKFRANKVRDCL